MKSLTICTLDKQKIMANNSKETVSLDSYVIQLQYCVLTASSQNITEKISFKLQSPMHIHPSDQYYILTIDYPSNKNFRTNDIS